MTESHPFEHFFIVTVRSRPGPAGVVLRINGRPQNASGRPSGWIDYSNLTLGARCWSNDPDVPPYYRGFLSGSFAQVLFYDRALSDQELVANEVFLWNTNRRLLEPPDVPVSNRRRDPDPGRDDPAALR